MKYHHTIGRVDIISNSLLLQAAIRGYLLRRSLIWDIRKEFMIVVNELEPYLLDGTVTWGNNLNIISLPHFRVAAPEESISEGQRSSGGRANKKNHKKKVKSSSTQTDVHPQPVASRPGVQYMDTTPSKELFDSFSSLPSLEHSMEQPHQHNEQATSIIQSVTMETTKKHLVGKGLHHSDKKRHRKSKKEKFKVTEGVSHHNVSLSVSTPHTTTYSVSPPVHYGTTQPTSPVTTRQQHFSLASTPCNNTMTHSTDIMTHHTQVQPHPSDIMTHHTQVQPHSSDIMTHHTQVQPHSSDIMTHHTQVQPYIRDQVRHWSKFEQLKAKYLPCGNVSSDNKRILHSRFLAKQKL